MVIKKLTLANFRNYEAETFRFTDGLNVLTGRNAQGKTNCAEAVFYLCTGASLRIRHDRQLIRRGETCARISAEASTRFGSVALEAAIFENKRELYLNGNRLARAADFVGNMNSVFFSPGELRLIQDGPDERRRFLNLSISQTSREYCTALARYQRILDQRNNLLKERDVSLVLETLPVWDEQLALFAARIVRHRRRYLKQLSPLASDAHAYLTDGAETLSLRLERHAENTARVIQYLAKQPLVEKINHPSLPSHPDNALYRKYFPHGGGSIFTFDIRGGVKEAHKFIDSLRVFSLLANVADVKSLVIHPATTTHSQLTEAELAQQGIRPNTIRLSVGTEHIDDILADLENGFRAVSG